MPASNPTPALSVCSQLTLRIHHFLPWRTINICTDFISQIHPSNLKQLLRQALTCLLKCSCWLFLGYHPPYCWCSDGLVQGMGRGGKGRGVVEEKRKTPTIIPLTRCPTFPALPDFAAPFPDWIYDFGFNSLLTSCARLVQL